MGDMADDVDREFHLRHDARLCCCTHGFYCHDPGACTAPGCWCRGFHEPDASPALHAALHVGIAPCACPVNATEGLGGIEHAVPCGYALVAP